MRIPRLVQVLAAIVVLIVPLSTNLLAAGPGQRADVLIAELPTALTIYDVYQQRLSPGAQRSIPPCTPMVIEAEHTTLSDGFTPCMKVLIDGSSFYLLRDQGGDIAGLAGAGYSHILRNMELIADSIRVLDAHALRFLSADKSSSHLLRGGTIARRLFRDHSLFFCEVTSPSPSYGWIPMNAGEEGTVWETIRVAPMQTTLSASMISSIRQRVDRANSIVQSLFTAFNRETNGDRIPPHWSVTVGTDGLSCTPDDSTLALHFQKSIYQLSKEIEAVLIGTPFIVIEDGATVSVVRRDGHGGSRGS